MTIQEFYAELQRHDWTYAMSDDHSVWRRGTENAQRLFSLARGKPVWEKLYEDYKDFAWGKRETAPEIPQE
jgi:hypothetical protein